MPNNVNDRLHEDYEDEIDLAALFLVVWSYRKLISTVVILLVFLVIVLSLVTERKYSASTSIINMVDSSRVMKSVQQGYDFDTVVQSPRNNILLAILESETLAVRVIKKANLLPYLFPKRWDSEKKEWKTKFDANVPTEKMGRAVLKKMIKIKSTDNDPTITITVTTRYPELSPLIANTYTKELEDYLKLNSFSTVQKSRIFLESKLKGAKDDLENLKKKMEDFQEENGVYDLEQQAEASMEAYNELALQLNKKETARAYIQSISSPMNPKVQNLGMQIDAIKSKINNLKNGTGSVEDGDDSGGTTGKSQNFIALNRISQLRMQLQKLNHDIEIQQKTYDLLIDSYEKITIQEAKEKIFVTVLDQADVPIRPDSKRTFIKIILAIFGGVFFGLCLVFCIEFIKKQMEVRFDEIDKTGKPGDVQSPFSVIPKEDKASQGHSPALDSPEQQMKD